MKGCQICGLQYPDEASFCAKCGKEITALQARRGTEPVASVSVNRLAEKYLDKPKKKGGLIVGIIAAVVVVAAVVGIMIASSDGSGGSGGGRSSNTAEAVAEKAAEYALDCDLYAVSKLYHKEVIKENDMDDESFKEDCMEMKDEYQEMLYELGNVELSYDIKDEDEITGEDLEDIQDYYEDEYNLDIENAKVFEVEICAEIDGEENEETIEIIVVKIDGKWYLDIRSDVDLF